MQYSSSDITEKMGVDFRGSTIWKKNNVSLNLERGSKIHPGVLRCFILFIYFNFKIINSVNARY